LKNDRCAEGIGRSIQINMGKLNTILLTVVLLGISQLSFGTAQVPDYLIIEKDTIAIFANPLEQLYNHKKRPKTFFEKESRGSTACWRGYYAYWKLEDNRLFLIKIVDCCNNKTTANLGKIFGKKYHNNKVFADWFTGELLSPEGKLVYYEHMGYGSIYEKEVIYAFEKGIFQKKYILDNSKSYESIFNQKQDSLIKFLYSNIQWKNLPDINEEKKKVFVRIISGETKTQFSVEIGRGINDVLDKEALRVARLIPEWDVYYQHGKVCPMRWTVCFIFSTEMKLKYGDR